MTPGTKLMREGEVGDEMYILIEGAVLACRSSQCQPPQTLTIAATTLRTLIRMSVQCHVIVPRR